MENSMLIQSPFLFEFPGEKSDSGSLNFWGKNLLFPQGIQRCFWITKVDEHTIRGNHAHWQESQLLVTMHGSVSVFVQSVSGNRFSYTLNSPAVGLYVPPLNWVSIKFTAKAVLLGISDQEFAEEDYIRDKHYFESLRERYI